MTHHTRRFESSLTLSFQIVDASLYSGQTLTEECMKLKLEQTVKQLARRTGGLKRIT